MGTKGGSGGFGSSAADAAWLAEYAAGCAAYDAGIEKAGADAAATEGATAAEFAAHEEGCG